MEELRQRYAQSLPQKGRDIERCGQAWTEAPEDRAALVELHQQVHRLSGSAPAYGYDDIGALAQPIDAVIAEWLRDGAGRPAADIAAALAPRLRALVTALAASGPS